MTTPLLDREEYIEQMYFFRVYRERLEDDRPSQEILATIREEILATTKLTLAIDFLKDEILLKGRIHEGMARLPHYFTPFQTFVMERTEADKSRFDQRIALQVLERQAEYLSGQPKIAGLFVYQFECIARNRLGYDAGMTAMSADPFFDENWKDWILMLRLQLGTADFADFLYYRSEHHTNERRRLYGQENFEPSEPTLFSEQEGRIARANRGKDPLFMFAALQRHLGYPTVPRPKRKTPEQIFHPALESRLQKLEKRLQFLESENKGGIDLSQFYTKPPQITDGEST